MNKCIYSKSTIETFEKREHVIPAFLGCKTVLPVGVVSDQSNWSFSKLEDQLSHQSGLSVFRSIYGPGKRGELDFVGHPILAHYEPGKSFFVQFSKNHINILPQFELRLELGGFVLNFLKRQEGSTKENLFQGIKLINNFLSLSNSSKFHFFQDPLSSNRRWIVTTHKDHWYVSSRIFIPLDEIQNSVKQGKPNPNSRQFLSFPLSNTLSIGKVVQDTDFSKRALAKIIFNSYALIFGQESALNPRFDAIRNYVLFGTITPSLFEIFEGVIDTRKIIETFHLDPLCHLVYFFQNHGGLFGFASFYGGAYAFSLRISDALQEDHQNSAFVCEWKQQKDTILNVSIMKNEKFAFSHEEASKPYELLSESGYVLGRALSNKAKDIVHEIINKGSYPPVICYFDSKTIEGYSQAGEILEIPALSLNLNCTLSDKDFNTIFIQGMNFIKYFSKSNGFAKPHGSSNPGEKEIANLLNCLATFGTLDMHCTELGYDPGFIYEARMNAIVTQIINLDPQSQLSDFFTVKFALETAFVTLYNPKHLFPISTALGDPNHPVIILAKKIIAIILRVDLSEIGSFRFKQIKTIIEMLNIAEHVSL